MLEFRKYGPAPAEEKDPPVCVVTYPETCGRPAVGEVWSIPFCEAHGIEAHTAARLEAFEDAGRELDRLTGRRFEEVPNRNPILQRALESIVLEDGSPSPDHGAAIRSAYDLEAATTDPDTLAFDYGGAIEKDGPYDWWCEAREMIVGFMRQAYEAASPLLAALEPIREYATVQQELALDDMERRFVQPRRAAREEARKRTEPAGHAPSEILAAANGALGSAIDLLDDVSPEAFGDRDGYFRAKQAIAEAGQLVCEGQRRVSETRPA